MKLGLIKGRHEIPQVEGRYIFIEDLDPTDVKEAEGKAYSVLAGIKAVYPDKHIDLYVTGLTMALIAVLNASKRHGMSVTLHHFDRETGEYFPQEVLWGFPAYWTAFSIEIYKKEKNMRTELINKINEIKENVADGKTFVDLSDDALSDELYKEFKIKFNVEDETEEFDFEKELEKSLNDDKRISKFSNKFLDRGCWNSGLFTTA